MVSDAEKPWEARIIIVTKLSGLLWHVLIKRINLFDISCDIVAFELDFFNQSVETYSHENKTTFWNRKTVRVFDWKSFCSKHFTVEIKK